MCGVGWGGRRRALPADSHSCCPGGLPPSMQLYCKHAMRHAHAGTASSLATTTTRVLSSSSMAWSSPFDRAWVHLGVGACRYRYAPYDCSPRFFYFFQLSLGDNVLIDQMHAGFYFIPAAAAACSGVCAFFIDKAWISFMIFAIAAFTSLWRSSKRLPSKCCEVM